jgi:hypothetical protein
MAQRYFMKITTSNIAEGYVVPKDDLIEILENGTERRFTTSDDHIEVDTKATAVSCRNTKYDPTAESGDVKTTASFTQLQSVNNRWNLDTGNEQELVLTENADGVVTSSTWEDI